MTVKYTETELAALVIRYLDDLGWDIYQEVQMFSFGRRADIVAVKGSITWIIETKMNMGLDVIQQAFRWNTHAHYVSVAVPLKLRARTTNFAQLVCRKFGIGVLLCDFDRSMDSGIDEIRKPKLFRNPNKHLRETLSEEHKTYAEAGNGDSKFWSPFKKTCSELIRIVTRNPGITMKELVDSIDHHYSSDTGARGSLVQWIRLGKVEGIKLDETVWPMRIYPAEYKIPDSPNQLAL